MSRYGVRSLPRIGFKSFPRQRALVQSSNIRYFSTKKPELRGRRRWPWYLASIVVGYGGRVLYDSYTEDDQSRGLNPQAFTKYFLRAKDAVTATSAIFTLSSADLPKDSTLKEAWRKGVWSVEFKQPQLQIARAYTPLPPSVETAPKGHELRFLIRKDLDGEVSTYLHQLPTDSNIEVRGPQLEFLIPENTNHIVFLAGGTGIAPALQAAYCLLEAREITKGRHIHILWASRRREDCWGGSSDNQTVASSWWRHLIPLRQSQPREKSGQHPGSKGIIVKELDALKSRHPGQIEVDYFVDEESSFIAEALLAQAIKTEATDAFVMVSGPDGFVKHLAGPKNLSNGVESQGPVGGILQRLGLNSESVWKL